MKQIYKSEKAIKYAQARVIGNSMKKSAEIAGYGKTGNLMLIENTKAVQEASKTFKEALLKKFTKDHVADILKRNADQEQDKGASNNAAKLIMDKIEPETIIPEISSRVLVVFKK